MELVILHNMYVDTRHPLHKAEVLGLDGEEELLLEDLFGGVKRHVEARDAGVGRGQVLVVRRPDGD